MWRTMSMVSRKSPASWLGSGVIILLKFQGNDNSASTMQADESTVGNERTAQPVSQVADKIRKSILNRIVDLSYP